MTTVFVSGCYDILTANHIDFFTRAKALGDRLVVSFASARILQLHKHRNPAMPDEHKKTILESLRMVDEVVIGDDTTTLGLDFLPHFLLLKPDLLVVTEDDRYSDLKRFLCGGTNCTYTVIPRNNDPVSTTSIRKALSVPMEVPLRVDFAGGWLDHPRYAIRSGRVVNCTVDIFVASDSIGPFLGKGLGTSAALAILEGRDPFLADQPAGWQDPAVIRETGLCIWESGPVPRLLLKSEPSFLLGKMALLDIGTRHLTRESILAPHDLGTIYQAGFAAEAAIRSQNIFALLDAIHLSYVAQLWEGMLPLPEVRDAARKYCGSGWGGYALYVFPNNVLRDEFITTHNARPIEPFISGA